MKTKKIVTNLRMDEFDWIQVKSMAAEAGISVNEYINEIIKEETTRRELAVSSQTREKKLSVWDLPKLAKMKDKPMGLSAEDELIYS